MLFAIRKELNRELLREFCKFGCESVFEAGMRAVKGLNEILSMANGHDHEVLELSDSELREWKNLLLRNIVHFELMLKFHNSNVSGDLPPLIWRVPEVMTQCSVIWNKVRNGKRDKDLNVTMMDPYKEVRWLNRFFTRWFEYITELNKRTKYNIEDTMEEASKEAFMKYIVRKKCE